MKTDTKKLRELAEQRKLSPSPAGVLQVAVANGFFTRFERIGSITEMCDELDALREERDRMREALAFYSDRANHKPRRTTGYARNKPSGHYSRVSPSQISMDRGKRARTALGETK
jgi:hypothetical protein